MPLWAVPEEPATADGAGCQCRAGTHEAEAEPPLLTVCFLTALAEPSSLSPQGRKGFYFHYWALFDGHAGSGAAVMASKRLHLHICEQLRDLVDILQDPSPPPICLQHDTRAGAAELSRAPLTEDNGEVPSDALPRFHLEKAVSHESLVIGAIENAFKHMVSDPQPVGTPFGHWLGAFALLSVPSSRRQVCSEGSWQGGSCPGVLLSPISGVQSTEALGSGLVWVQDLVTLRSSSPLPSCSLLPTPQPWGSRAPAAHRTPGCVGQGAQPQPDGAAGRYFGLPGPLLAGGGCCSCCPDPLSVSLGRPDRAGAGVPEHLRGLLCPGRRLPHGQVLRGQRW